MKKTWFIVLFIISLVILFLYINFKSDNELSSRLKNKKIIEGSITSITYFPRGFGLLVNYEFTFKSILVSKNKRIFISYDSIKSVRGILLNKYLPVVYDSLDYKNNEMILSISDSDKYSIELNDSDKNILMRLDSLIMKDN